MILTEAINVKKYYDDAVKKVFNILVSTEYTFGSVVSSIETVLQDIANEALADNPSTVFESVRVTVNAKSVRTVSGQIEGSSPTSLSITIFIPNEIYQSPMSDMSAKARMLIARKIARTFTHEIAHMMQYIKSHHDQQQASASRFSTITKSRLSKGDQSSLKNATIDQDRSIEDRQKASLMGYYGMKHETSTHAINAAQEILDSVNGDVDQALSLFKNENKDKLKKLYMDSANKNLYNFWFVVKNHPDKSIWKQFWKEVYRQISDMQKTQ